MSARPNTTDQVDVITRCHHNQRMDHFLHVAPIRTYAHLQIKIKKEYVIKMSHKPAVVKTTQNILFRLGYPLSTRVFCSVPPVLTDSISRNLTLGSPNHTAWRWPPIKPRLLRKDGRGKVVKFSGWWLNQSFQKYGQVKLDHFTKYGVENKKYLKTPPRNATAILLKTCWPCPFHPSFLWSVRLFSVTS